LPLYEYKCLKCARRTEKIENVNGPHLKKCPHCGGKVELMISASAIQFKGSGWYVTDYSGKSKGSDGSKDGKLATEASKDATSKESAAKGSDAKESSTKETKEAKENKAEKTEKAEKAGKKK
jgi:putative FmdB family regulatory protein